MRKRNRYALASKDIRIVPLKRLTLEIRGERTAAHVVVLEGDVAVRRECARQDRDVPEDCRDMYKALDSAWRKPNNSHLRDSVGLSRIFDISGRGGVVSARLVLHQTCTNTHYTRSSARRPWGSAVPSRICPSSCRFLRTERRYLSAPQNACEPLNRTLLTAPPTLLFRSNVFHRLYRLFGPGFVPTSRRTTTFGWSMGQKALKSHLCELIFFASMCFILISK